MASLPTSDPLVSDPPAAMPTQLLDTWPDAPQSLSAGRYFVRVPVARLLSDHDLSIAIHIVAGEKPGPTLGLMAGIHGDETPGVRILQQLLAALDPAELAGTILAVPVANPLAWAAQQRATPEMDVDHNNLARVFHATDAAAPAFDSVARRLAATLERTFFAAISHFIDFHCFGRDTAARLMLYRTSQPSEIVATSAEMARRFNIGVIHGVGGGQGTTSAMSARLGIPTIVAEFGATRCHIAAEQAFVQEAVAGTQRVMEYLEMLDSAPPNHASQLLVESATRISPSTSGYFLPTFDLEDLYAPVHRQGIEVTAGQTLGHLFDTYTLQPLEQITAPHDGRLIILFRAGPYNVGSRNLSLATGTWTT
jgi:predicted deacylase